MSAFNLHSQAGVMAVLAAVRASKISAAEKNDIRDLVFAYTNGGGDASIKIALEQKLLAHQIQPVTIGQRGQVGPALAFGSYRPTPTFKAPLAPPAKPVSAMAAAATVPVGVPNPVPASPSVGQFSQEGTQTPPVIPTAPAQAPTPAPAFQSPQPAPASVPTPAPQPQPSPIAPTPAADTQYLERIREIKTAVNSKVGNPVNLVDIDNKVGREYMNALLEAMKKLSTGAVSEMGPVMQRLESAYANVEIAIVKHHGSKGPHAASPEPATALPIAPLEPAALPPTPAPLPVRQTAEAQIVPDTPQFTAPIGQHTPVSEPRPSAAAVSFVPSPAPVVRQEPELNIAQDSRIPLQETPAVVINEIPPRPSLPPVEEPKGPSGFDTPVSSLAQNSPIKTPQDLPESNSVTAGEDPNSLFTAEIDSGLNQLLSDWILFKKSGLFGTGPKGKEHPLFKKIADLQVPLLLAGRFEGATQEIRQSVTDYMNGWRYEQGIVYQPGETFEKYLRRVIKHILNLQKKH